MAPTETVTPSSSGKEKPTVVTPPAKEEPAVTPPVNEKPDPTPPDKTLEELLNHPDVRFRIIFKGSPQRRTTSVSSADIKSPQGTMSSVTLSRVRDIGNLPKAFLFCVDSSGTNTVADTTGLGEYISATEDNITALQKAAGTSQAAILTVQYTSRHRPPDQIPNPRLSLYRQRMMDITDKAPAAVNIATTGLVVGSGKILSTHPAEMTDKEWNYVMVTNSLLHGMYLEPTSYTFQKARYPAFKLKASFPDPLDIGASGRSDSEPKRDQVCIPAFEVNDDSSVTITEVKSTFELSMAQHAFNSSNVAASVSGGFGSFSGGVSASASWSSSHSQASKSAKQMDILHASYNFPRVKVFFDSDDLEITKDCQALLGNIKAHKKPEDIEKFYRMYGHIFAGSVQLGGRLHTTKESTSSDETKLKEEKDTLKVAVGANFSSPFVSGSVSASHGSNNESNSNKASGKGSENLTWEAQGGETLYGSNPPVWVTTVGSFDNWRVTERGDVQDILTLLKSISNKPDEDWPIIFGNTDSGTIKARDPLVFSTVYQGIGITNRTDTKFRIARYKDGLDKLYKFFEAGPGNQSTWDKASKVCFVNQLDSNRVAIAMVPGPGFYQIQKLSDNDNDPSCAYVQNSLVSVGVKNNTGNSIQVKVTTDKFGSEKFYQVHPGQTERWQRDEYTIIYVKHSSSNTLFTYIGVSGCDLLVGTPSDPPSPIFNSVASSITVGASTSICVFNAQSDLINVRVSSTTGEEGSDRFFPVKPGQQATWARFGAEVVFVNGPHGTAVGAYYGELGRTLIVDQTITNDGK